MRTAILCAVFLIVGAAAGSLTTGYIARNILQRQNAIVLAGDLGGDVMMAEMIRQGQANRVLASLENTIPLQVKMVNDPEIRERTFLAESSIGFAKRFYICTSTPVPSEIADIIEAADLAEDACSEPVENSGS
jgi:hypothetical protein